MRQSAHMNAPQRPHEASAALRAWRAQGVPWPGAPTAATASGPASATGSKTAAAKPSAQPGQRCRPRASSARSKARSQRGQAGPWYARRTLVRTARGGGMGGLSAAS